MPNFNYQKICSDLLKDLPQRMKEIFERRFGLIKPERETLEAIGQSHGITRERVRQIEEEGFSRIRQKAGQYEKVFKYFSDVLKSFGDFKKEGALLSFLGGKNSINHVLFLLNLDKSFIKVTEDNNLYSYWTRKKEVINSVKTGVNSVLNWFQKDKKPLSFEELYRARNAEFAKITGKKTTKNVFNSFVELSKKIQKNPENKYGMSDWLEINPRGVKDKAYLVFKKEGKPLHFTQVATFIEKKLPFELKRKVHTATVHNELIKDSRFVLIGRGTYALAEWGYEPGVLKDVLVKIIKESKTPLSKEDILKKVSKQRIIKANTVWLNLQDKNAFLKNQEGKYTIKES